MILQYDTNDVRTMSLDTPATTRIIDGTEPDDHVAFIFEGTGWNEDDGWTYGS